jgi:hypothetical protein
MVSRPKPDQCQHEGTGADVSVLVACVTENGCEGEEDFPVSVVSRHGLLAAATVLLVLLTALTVGGS